MRLQASWYIGAKNDRTVHPAMERFVAKRMGAKVTEVASSHVPMLSHPDLVIDVIRTAAKEVQKSNSSSVKRIGGSFLGYCASAVSVTVQLACDDWCQLTTPGPAEVAARLPYDGQYGSCAGPEVGSWEIGTSIPS
jgi:hypothetical protein